MTSYSTPPTLDQTNEFSRYDAFIEAQEFESDLITNSLPTEQLTLLLITIALAVGGLIYFCINLVRIFPGTSKIGHETDIQDFFNSDTRAQHIYPEGSFSRLSMDERKSLGEIFTDQ